MSLVVEGECELADHAERSESNRNSRTIEAAFNDRNQNRHCVSIALNSLLAPTRRAMSERNDDTELVRKATDGNKEAYRALVEKYQQRVFGIALEVVKSKEDAEDIAQEVFVKAYLSLSEFKGQSSFYTWLYRIAYNMAVDFRRRMQRRGGPPMEFDESKVARSDQDALAPKRFDGPQEVMLRKEEARQIQKVLAEISPEHRTVITLREIDGLSYDEIAEVVGVSKGTVMSRLHYARKRLQNALVGLGLRSTVPADEQGNESSDDNDLISMKTT